MWKISPEQNISKWIDEVNSLAEKIDYKEALQIDRDHFYTGIVMQDPEGTVVAACIVYRNPAMQVCGQQALSFGNVLVIHESGILDDLISYVKKIAAGLDIDQVIGPLNGSTWNSYRIAVSGEGRKYFLDLDHPAYYGKLFEDVRGLKVINKYFSTIDYDLNPLAEPYQNALSFFSEKGIVIRDFLTDSYETELKKIYLVCEQAFRESPFYTPVTFEVFKEKYIPIKPYLDPELILMAYKGSELVGFIFGIRDLCNRDAKGVIVKTMARKPGTGIRGLGMHMSAYYHYNVAKSGYQYMIHAFMAEDNLSRAIAEKFNGKILKTYHLYAINS